MADIINFQAYVNAKDEEKKRIKRISMLSTKRDFIVGVLHNINNSIEVSLMTKHFGELNQIVTKHNIIGYDLMEVIIATIEQYDAEIQREIIDLENENCMI